MTKSSKRPSKSIKTAPKKAARTSAAYRARQKQALKPAAQGFRFLCDCMMGLAAALIVGSALHLGAFRDHSSRVLGVSTHLDKDTILQTINLERAGSGLGPLTLDERLDQAALAKGENMLTDNYWAHVNPSTGAEPWSYIQASGYQYQSAGENLGRDFTDETSLVKAWMDSPSHRENILNPAFSDVGLAVLTGEMDGQDVVLIVNLFGQPKLTTGQITQVATYNQADGQLVLAGQVVPAVSQHSLFQLDWQWVLAMITGVGITLVLTKLSAARSYIPRKRRR